MSPASDPLRNTLDQLALDPRAKDDRKYLVSVLRRLGYSDQEIREALGIEGEEGRLIEVEYTGKGPVIVTDHVSAAPPEASGFTVIDEDEPDFEHDRPVFQEADDWSEDWDEEGAWEPDEPDDAPEEVEFIPEEKPPERVAFAVRRGGLREAAIPDARHGKGGSAPAVPTAEQARRSWEPVDPPASGAASGDVAVQAGWIPVDAEETATDEAWGRPDEAPGQSWEPTDEEPEDWEEVPQDPDEAAAEAGLETPELDTADIDEALGELEDRTPAEAPAWDEDGAEPAPPADEGVFHLDEYTLYTRNVELSTGRTQTIFFFAKSRPKSGRPAPLPDGYTVERNDRTGLPYLRRTEGAQPRPDRPVHAGTKKRAAKKTGSSDRCHAVTRSGDPCKNHARDGSKYCGTHKNWRGPTID